MRLQLLVLRKSLNEEERGAPVALWLEFFNTLVNLLSIHVEKCSFTPLHEGQ